MTVHWVIFMRLWKIVISLVHLMGEIKEVLIWRPHKSLDFELDKQFSVFLIFYKFD